MQFTHELTPLVRKVYEVLPLYVAMSGHPESAKRILTLVRTPSNYLFPSFALPLLCCVVILL